MAVSKAENFGTLGDEGMRTERHSEFGRQYVGILPSRRSFIAGSACTMVHAL
jgi:hypothetical protein